MNNSATPLTATTQMKTTSLLEKIKTVSVVLIPPQTDQLILSRLGVKTLDVTLGQINPRQGTISPNMGDRR